MFVAKVLKCEKEREREREENTCKSISLPGREMKKI
jgi:hypothetical protein